MTSKWPEWHPQTLDNSHARSLAMDWWILKPISSILYRHSIRRASGIRRLLSYPNMGIAEPETAIC